jgi:Recombination endonuclease VII
MYKYFPCENLTCLHPSKRHLSQKAVLFCREHWWSDASQSDLEHQIKRWGDDQRDRASRGDALDLNYSLMDALRQEVHTWEGWVPSELLSEWERVERLARKADWHLPAATWFLQRLGTFIQAAPDSWEKQHTRDKVERVLDDIDSVQFGYQLLGEKSSEIRLVEAHQKELSHAAEDFLLSLVAASDEDLRSSSISWRGLINEYSTAIGNTETTEAFELQVLRYLGIHGGGRTSRLNQTLNPRHVAIRRLLEFAPDVGASKSVLQKYLNLLKTNSTLSVCCLCGQSESSDWVVEHNHMTGLVRGFAHSRCNTLEGQRGQGSGHRFEHIFDLFYSIDPLSSYGIPYPDWRKADKAAVNKGRAKVIRIDSVVAHIDAVLNSDGSSQALAYVTNGLIRRLLRHLNDVMDHVSSLHSEPDPRMIEAGLLCQKRAVNMLRVDGRFSGPNAR